MTTTTFAPQGSVNLVDLRYSISQTRTNFTRLRGKFKPSRDNRPVADFITLICLICEIYRNYADELAPVQQFHPSREKQYNKGHTSTVSHTHVSRNSASQIARGTTSTKYELLIVKRPRQSILEEQSYALVSFITELRIRTHPPIRAHPSIARFRGVGWDFEDEASTVPRPLLLEELAPQGALDNFWERWKFVQMNFKSKLDMCRDVAEGLLVLHHCGVVHGDVKPENILVFPRHDANDSFMVKLTDFGHSVFEHNRLNALPAFTPQWCAPEVKSTTNMSFREMKLTDCYSYGLVILSIMIGRPFYGEFEDVESHKQDDSMLSQAIQLIEKEDRENNNSDFDVGVIHSLLQQTIRLSPRYRNLNRCLHIMSRYDKINKHQSHRNGYRNCKPLSELNVAEMVTIGYQTLSQTSHQLKEHITRKLIQIGSDDKEPRRVAAAWELAVCYFSGFGVPVSFQNCSHWLLVALKGGVPAARTFFKALNDAMEIECDLSLISDISSQSKVAQVQGTTPGIDTSVMATQVPEVDIDSGQDSDAELSLGSERSEDPDPNDLRKVGSRIALPHEVFNIMQNGTIERFRDFLGGNPELLNGQDSDGNTPLLLAAKRQDKSMLDYLISQNCLDASISNKSEHTILHFLAPFDDSTIRDWIPRLVERKADINHEALPMRSGNEAMMFSAGIRCCSLLNAILYGNLTLLTCLLEACHSPDNKTPCRICEAGSRFRRILAVSLSIFQAGAVELLVAHVRGHRESHSIDLSRIEVWAGDELLPLHKVPFNSVAVAAMDLPESFFRAINYGNKYADSLERTIRFLLTIQKNKVALSYSMLREAVAKNSIEAVNTILHEGRRCDFKKQWWLQVPVLESPLLESISLGSRETYEAFLKDDPSIFSNSLEWKCRMMSCGQYGWNFRGKRWARLLFGGGEVPTSAITVPEHKHETNHVQLALEVFVNASHQDRFFLDSIISNAARDLITVQPAYFFANSILNSSFPIASYIAEQCPDIWSPRKSHSSNFNENDGGPSGQFVRFFPWSWEVKHILGEGSYEQVQFVLKALLPLRSSHPGRKSKKSAKGRKCLTKEDGIPEWTRCPLSHEEYDYLLRGNIGTIRTDRQALWNVIQEQITLGHSTSMFYLRYAMVHGNTDALEQMLARGWCVNGPFWAYFMTPLQFCLDLDKISGNWRQLLRFLNPDLPQDDWIGSSTHATVYAEYRKLRDDHSWSEWNARKKVCQEIIIGHGGKISPVVTLLRKTSITIQIWAFIMYVLIYAVVLPFTLVYATTSTWTSMSTGQKFGFVYLWAPLAFLQTLVYIVTDHTEVAINPQVIWLLVSLLLFIVNNFVIPVLIIALNWRPFHGCKSFVEDGNIATRCTNYSYLIPIVFAVGEGVIWIVVELFLID